MKNNLEKKYMQDFYNKCLQENRMLGVSVKRWESSIRPCLDLLFKLTRDELNAKIEGIAEDGEQTWILIDNLVVPTDKKLQSKYLKKKMEY